jgi:hypothetical protein
MYPYVNQKNQEKLKEGGYGTREFKDYTAHGLLDYYYETALGKCLITRDPNIPGMWVIRNKEGNVIPGCSGSFSGNGNGSMAAEKRWKDYCAYMKPKKPAEEITS